MSLSKKDLKTLERATKALVAVSKAIGKIRIAVAEDRYKKFKKKRVEKEGT